MAELWKVTLPSGNTYELKDKYARELVAQLLNFDRYLGVTTTELTDGCDTNPVTINGESVTAGAGDVVTLATDNSEFIFSSLGVWQKFGTLSGLGALAYKNSASAEYTPAGTVTGDYTPAGEVTGNYTPEGTVSCNYTPEGEVTGDYTPEGEVTGSYTPEGTISGSYTPEGDVTGDYTPEGTISDVVLSTISVNEITSAGSMPTFSVSDECLIITGGAVPAFSAVTVANGSVVSQPTFSGSASSLSLAFSGSAADLSLAFSGSSADLSLAFSGTSASLSLAFSGTSSSLSLAFSGTSSSLSLAFSGTSSTIEVS